MRTKFLHIFFIITCLPFSTGLAIEVGDKAPPLRAETWINGAAVDPAQPDGKTLYIVESWATWCPQCQQAIPLLNKLHDQLAQSNVVVIGMTYEPEAMVRSYAERMGMKFRIALDPSRQVIGSYMGNNNGIPLVFVIGTNGLVLWKGHPLGGLAGAVKKIQNGSFNPEDAVKQEKIEGQLQKLLGSRDYERALRLVDDLIAIDDQMANYYQLKISLLAETGKPDQIKPVYRAMLSAFSDSAEDLNALAWQASTAPLEIRDLPTACEATHKAVELSGRKDYTILNTLARVNYALGLLESAIDVQQEALGLCRDDGQRKAFEETLNYYKNALELSRKEMNKANKEEK